MFKYKLTDNETRIIVAASLDADSSVSDVARAARVKYRSVHTAMQRLYQRDLIKPFWLISNDSLGLIDWCMFLSVDFQRSADRERFHRFIQSSPSIAFASELSGEYNYSISFFGNRAKEVAAFLEKLNKELKPSSFTRTMATRLSWTVYPPSFLLTNSKSTRRLIERGAGDPVAIDHQDSALLSLLSSRPQDSIVQYAKALKVSKGTIYYRLKSLRDRGIILGKILLLNTNALGLYSFRLLIRERGADNRFFEGLKKYCLDNPNVTTLVHCMGAWDYEINIELLDSAELNMVIADLQQRFQGLIYSIISVAQLKVLRLSQYPFKP